MPSWSIRKFFCWLPVAFIFLSSLSGVPQEVTVMSSGGFSAAYKQLVPEFEKLSGIHVTTLWGPSMGTTPGAIPVRISRGEHADVVIIVQSELDDLAEKGDVVRGSRVDLAYSRIGMAVRAGAQIPDIRSVDALRRTLLQARSVAYSDSASGVYVASELFRKLGIEKELASKSRQIPAEPVGIVVARGEAEIGFQQMSELKPIPGIAIVGLIPEQVQKVTVFSAGIVANGTDKQAGRALIHYLASPEACAVIRETALEPVACAANRK